MPTSEIVDYPKIIEVHPIGKVSIAAVAVNAAMRNHFCEVLPYAVVPYYNWSHTSDVQLVDPQFYASREVAILLCRGIFSSIIQKVKYMEVKMNREINRLPSIQFLVGFS